MFRLVLTVDTAILFGFNIQVLLYFLIMTCQITCTAQWDWNGRAKRKKFGNRQVDTGNASNDVVLRTRHFLKFYY
jgi:hypothetical protein